MQDRLERLGYFSPLSQYKVAPFGPVLLSFQANSGITLVNTLVLHATELVRVFVFFFCIYPQLGTSLQKGMAGRLAVVPHPTIDSNAIFLCTAMRHNLNPSL